MLLFILFSLFGAHVLAQSHDGAKNEIHFATAPYLTLGVILILCGGVQCSSGYRAYTYSPAFVGFYFSGTIAFRMPPLKYYGFFILIPITPIFLPCTLFTVVAWIAGFFISAFVSSQTPSEVDLWTALLTWVGSGIVGAIAFHIKGKHETLNRIVTGLFGGFALILMVLSLRSDTVLPSPAARYGVVAAFTVSGAAIAMIKKYRSAGWLFAFAFSGSYAMFNGFDVFFATGYHDGYRAILNPRVIYNFTLPALVMASFALIVAVLGGLWQLKIFPRLQELKDAKASSAEEELELDLKNNEKQDSRPWYRWRRKKQASKNADHTYL
ncbi:uncharacterized protein VTP21DRAFT_3124 [Calcarisporiella thermophila]|uniref:uncharacterized protein n=1 Tax=Calcarisporiella thermophila TaxID=911321 RepID=UPI0037449FF1